MATTNGIHPKPNEDTFTLLSPRTMCHYVLKTTPENYNPMINFYLTTLGARITHSNPHITFLTYDDEHHRLGILKVPSIQPSANKTTGLAHVAFGYATLADLATSYEQKKARGILPGWCVNHGMTTSMYYTDPDGNQIETQVDNFETAAEGLAFMEGERFAENPVGVDFDPEELVRRVRSGEDEAAIKAMPDIGKRMSRAEKVDVRA